MQPIWRVLNNPVYRFGLWCLLLCTLVVTLMFQTLTRGHSLSTYLLDLLPATEQDTGSAAAASVFTKNFSDTVVLTVSAPERETSRLAAQKLDSLLNSHQTFARLQTYIDLDDWYRMYQFYEPYRYSLLSDSERSLPTQDLENHLYQRVITMMTSPVGITNSHQLVSDPLFQLPLWFESLAGDSGDMAADEGMLAVEKDGQYHVMLFGFLDGEALSLNQQDTLVNSLYEDFNLVRTEYPDIEINASGMIFHAKAGADSARSEVSTIGLGSVLGIIFLLLLAFRSPSPLLLCLLSVTTGIFAGDIVTVAIFGQIHVMTLVFGASLTGISIDYAFHYMAEWLREGKSWSPLKGLRHVMPGISLGLATSLLGYLPMLVTPFPGLQQIAVFSSAGLLGAWLTVVLAYPLLLKKPYLRDNVRNWPLPLVDRILSVWKKHLPEARARWLIALVPLCVLVLPNLSTNDDIRQLQSRVPELVATDNRVSEIMGSLGDNRFFLVRGSTQEDLLINTESLALALTTAVEQGSLGGFRAISSVLPSQQSQQENYHKISAVFGEHLPQLWQQMGFSEAGQEQALALFREAEGKRLTPEVWRGSPGSDMYEHLWLGKFEGEYFTAVLLFAPSENWNAYELETLTAVEFIDITGNTSELFGRYRVLMGWLLTGAYILISLLLVLRYGIAGTFKVVFPPLLSVLLTLSLLTISGETINLFHILALIMVLGIGIDYTLFFHEAGKEQRYTFMAITLSAITTVLSFGLLSLSATAAIQGFGLTVLTGITFCYLLSPYAIRKELNETD